MGSPVLGDVGFEMADKEQGRRRSWSSFGGRLMDRHGHVCPISSRTHEEMKEKGSRARLTLRDKRAASFCFLILVSVVEILFTVKRLL